MIQDIGAGRFHNEYNPQNIKAEDAVLIFKNRSFMVKTENEIEIKFPSYKECLDFKGKYQYLFNIDNKNFFLGFFENDIHIKGYEYKNFEILRTAQPKQHAFAAATAYHLNLWYSSNKYCGRCGSELEHSKKQRMLYCRNCNNMIYPRISPAIIVAVKNGDRLLLTKYVPKKNRKNYALIGGFTEIGETPEETVKREVMEEVGLKIKNIKYYKSQPWGIDANLLLGFTAELDGNDKINLEEDELAEAIWVKREDIDIEFNDYSLTNELICRFKENKI